MAGLMNLTPADEWKRQQAGKPGFWEWASGIKEPLQQAGNFMIERGPIGMGTRRFQSTANTVGGLIDQGMANKAQHPIYGNLGTQAGWGTPPTPQVPDAGAAPQGPGGMPGNPLIDSMYQTMGLAKPEQPLTRPPVTPDYQPTGNPVQDLQVNLDKAKTDAGLPAEAPVPPKMQAAVTAETSKQAVETLKKDMAPEEASALDKFAGEFDFTTVGMALLASNDGSGNLSSNMGKALMAGRMAKMQQDATLKEDERYEREAQRDDRKVDVEETYKIGSLEDRAAQRKAQMDQWAIQNGQQKRSDETDAQYKDRMATVAEANAFTNYAESLAKGSGLDYKPSTPTGVAYAKTGFEALGIKPGEFSGLTEEEVSNQVGSIINTELEANPTADRNVVAKKAVELFMRDWENKGWMWGTDYKLKGTE